MAVPTLDSVLDDAGFETNGPLRLYLGHIRARYVHRCGGCPGWHSLPAGGVDTMSTIDSDGGDTCIGSGSQPTATATQSTEQKAPKELPSGLYTNLLQQRNSQTINGNSRSFPDPMILGANQVKRFTAPAGSRGGEHPHWHSKNVAECDTRQAR